MDFAHEGSIATLFPQIEQEAAALSQADLPIVTTFTDEAAQRRYWEVAGFARMACGGTHPRSTAEIGLLKLKRKNTGKGKDDTLFALVAGKVEFGTKGGRRVVNIVEAA